MDYFILLDAYQQLVGADQYAVSFEGSLSACQSQTNHDGSYSTLNKSEYAEVSSEPKMLTGPTGSQDQGRIAGVQRAAGFARISPKEEPAGSHAALLVAGGFALGAITGFLVNRLHRSSKNKGPKA